MVRGMVGGGCCKRQLYCRRQQDRASGLKVPKSDSKIGLRDWKPQRATGFATESPEERLPKSDGSDGKNRKINI
jgi:hypothetical protein